MNQVSRGPYNLTPEEYAAAEKEAMEFIQSPEFAKAMRERKSDRGPYIQKRPGLGVIVGKTTITFTPDWGKKVEHTGWGIVAYRVSTKSLTPLCGVRPQTQIPRGGNV